MKATLIVASIRPEKLYEFLAKWDNKTGCTDIIIVEDNPEKSDLSKYGLLYFNINIHHYSWKDVNKFKCFSNRSSAIKSFGFYKAMELNSDLYICLDDDCYPGDIKNLAQEHCENMQQKKWYTPIVNIDRVRGMPYFNLGNVKNVFLNIGFWSEVPDIDSIQALSQLYNTTSFYPLVKNGIVNKDRLMPICGMNLACTKNILPLMFFSTSGKGIGFDRFDDIWFGIVLQKIFSKLDYNISYGNPIVNHSRLSNPLDNLVKEAPGVRLNEYFWELIDNIELPDTVLSNDDAIKYYYGIIAVELNKHLYKYNKYDLKESEIEYIKLLSKNMLEWIKLFK